MVFITDDNSTLLPQILRVHYVYSEPNSAVRVVELKTPPHVYNRPIDIKAPQSLVKHPVISCLSTLLLCELY